MSQPTIGVELFGLANAEEHAEAVESIYRDLRPLREKGAVPEGTTYYEIADALVDTFSGYTGEGDIAPGDLSNLIADALEQLGGEDSTTVEGGD